MLKNHLVFVFKEPWYLVPLFFPEHSRRVRNQHCKWSIRLMWSNCPPLSFPLRCKSTAFSSSFYLYPFLSWWLSMKFSLDLCGIWMRVLYFSSADWMSLKDEDASGESPSGNGCDTVLLFRLAFLQWNCRNLPALSLRVTSLWDLTLLKTWTPRVESWALHQRPVL